MANSNRFTPCEIDMHGQCAEMFEYQGEKFACDCGCHKRETIYKQLQAAGVELDSHASDLYAKVSDVSKPIVEAYKFRQQVTVFKSNKDGAAWYDIPFAFDPYWDRCERSAKKREVKRQ